MKIKPWMWIAGALAALWLIGRAKASNTAVPDLMVQSQNLYFDP